MTELDGRPVVVSGGDDGSVRVWDLATGVHVAAHSIPGEVSSILLTGSKPSDTPASNGHLRMIACAMDRAAFLKTTAGAQTGPWEQDTATQFSGQILTAAWRHPHTLIIGTESGIAVLQVAQA